MFSLVGAVVYAPLLAAIFSFIYIKRAQFIGIVAVLLMLLASIGILQQLSVSNRNVFSLGGWNAPLGIHWSIDGLSGLMIFLANSIAVALAIYSRDYFSNSQNLKLYFWPIFLMLLAGINALFLSNDLFNWYVTLEIIGLAAVALVALSNNQRADIAAFRYLLVSLTGSLCYLAGVAIVYSHYATLDIYLLGDIVETNTHVAIALALMIMGLLLKSAIFPMHFWLAPAHSNAPAPVSALLSALVVKASFFIILQLWLNVFPYAYAQAIGVALSVLGILAIIWGAYCALRTPRLKLLIAYSTVAQLGYLMLFFPLSNHESYSKIALGGVVYFIIAHAFAKSALFLAAGNLQKLAGHDDIANLGVYAKHLPMTLFACSLAGASIIGLPPSGGFIAKWIVLNAALTTNEWYIVIVLALGGLLSAAYMFRILRLAFYAGKDSVVVNDANKISALMQWIPLVLAMAAILLGVNALPVLNMLSISELHAVNIPVGGMQ